MTVVIISIAVLLVLGLAAAVGLAFASKVFAAGTDELVEGLNRALPQINCGACGYAGCMAYAEAVAHKGAPVNLCQPGGIEVMKRLAAILEVEETECVPVRACVHCQGGQKEAAVAFQYSGIHDCGAAAPVHGGPKVCKYGCLGFGTCARVCPVNAITMNENGLPDVDLVKCYGCGLCVKACPVHIIETLPLRTAVILACSNRDFGAAVKVMCSVGCISCRVCAQVTASGAIRMEKGDPLPTVNYRVKGETFEQALAKCPMHCYRKV